MATHSSILARRIPRTEKLDRLQSMGSQKIGHDGVIKPARLLCPWDFPGKNTGVDCHFLLQIFPTQESNPGLLHCRQILYQLSYEGSPKQQQGEKLPVPQSRGRVWGLKTQQCESVLCIQSPLSGSAELSFHFHYSQ